MVDFQGDPVDMSGVTLRGAVRLKTGVTEFGFSRDDEGNGVISWESVPAGMWSYDVFMDDGSEESPLLYGRFVSSGRVTPDLPDEQQAVAGAVVVQLPEGSGCVQVMLDNASSAAWYAEQAKKYAANAGNSEVSAANSAAAAASSATDAAASATSAASSSSDAAHSAANAASSEAKAASSEANAMSSATAAAASASNASMSEANAAASQSSAAASASDAASSAASASTSANNAAASEASAESYAAAASKSASDAATSATSAANSATAAQQALEAIPEVDASGNMTLAGGLTAAGAINANGGINVPLAVGAPTNESGVNRLYAAGLAAVTDAFSVRCYPLPANCSSSNGTVFKTDKEPNSLYFNVPPNSSFTVKCGLVTNARPMHNYSSIRGWVAPVRLPAVSTKFTARFGQMTTVVRMGRDRDAFTLVPDQAAVGYRIGEIIDITFDHVRDAAAGGYHIRVREIYYSNAEQKWKMKTTQALAPETSSNNGYPVCVYAVVYEQYQDGGYDTEDRGALWLLHGGNSSRGCVKIATVKGVHCFESIYPFSGYYLDIENTNSWALAGAFLPATMHLHCNNVNPAYYGFSSMESNIIVSEAVEDFVDPEAETTTED